jgi:ABC-2 type transport system ATP-binding protein
VFSGRLRAAFDQQEKLMSMSQCALETKNLGKRYGRREGSSWALQGCTLALPVGRVAALVGPNGAGKTTLLHLAVGLLKPSDGDVRVFGNSPQHEPHLVLPSVGFIAQDHPLYWGFSSREMLTMGRKLNPRWDQQGAISRLQRLHIPLDRPISKLSGGQQSQVALALTLGKRADLILLDEPVASLDPLARRDFLRTLTEAVEEQHLTVLLSSHIIADLEQSCDYLIILCSGRVQLAGDITAIRRSHVFLTGPLAESEAVIRAHTILAQDYRGDETSLLIRTNGTELHPGPAWQQRNATMEDIVLAYLEQPATTQPIYYADGATVPEDSQDMEVVK